MKILALDVGDAWTGTAISDASGMFAQPYQTVKTEDLTAFLDPLLKREKIKTVIVGYPKTMKGTQSLQTKIVEKAKEALEKQFPEVTWTFWDERLSSKRADTLKKGTSQKDKIHSHSIAAAFILSSYLDYVHQQVA